MSDRQEIANRHGVPHLAASLTGSTSQELEADAAARASVIGLLGGALDHGNTEPTETPTPERVEQDDTERKQATLRNAGLPDRLAPLLTGSTDDELTTNATKLGRELGIIPVDRNPATELARAALANAERNGINRPEAEHNSHLVQLLNTPKNDGLLHRLHGQEEE